MDVWARDVDFDKLVSGRKQGLVRRSGSFFKDIIHNGIPDPSRAGNYDCFQRRVGIGDMAQECGIKGGVEFLKTFLVCR
jgi:hypothetical protein